MKRVRQRATSAELVVRRLLRHMGAHYRVNVRGLPGSPDIAHKGRKKAIFVNGCFWHFHESCDRGKLPRTNSDFWRSKLLENRKRDSRKVAALEDLGFDVLTVWECELADEDSLLRRLGHFWNSET